MSEILDWLLEEDPQNLRLRMLLASRYQQERRLLQKVSRV